MSLFDSVELTQGQSFAFGLAPLDSASLESEEFVPSSRLSLFVDEEGVVNIDGQLKLFVKEDPIDCVTEPSFSKGNLFIKGLSKALPTAVPIGGVVLWQRYIDWDLNKPAPIPGGFAICDGSVYELTNGKEWETPKLTAPVDELEDVFTEPALFYIQRLPEGAELLRKGLKLARLINRIKG